jgi:putative transposase
MDYIHANPVTRGLVEKPEDWHWSSYADHVNLRQGPLPLDGESLPFRPLK